MDKKQELLTAVPEVAAQFDIAGRVVKAEPWGTGHIHDTFAVTFVQGAAQRRYIFQRINRTIFKNVPAMMNNIARVTTHIRHKLVAIPGGDPNRETLTIVPTRQKELSSRPAWATAGAPMYSSRAVEPLTSSRTPAGL